jgi:glycerate 2-kinase
LLIKNYAELATTPLRAHALDIVAAGIERVLPTRIMMSALAYDAARQTLRVNGQAYSHAGGRLLVIGGGKASGLMAVALEDIVGVSNISGGIVNCKDAGYATRVIEVVKAGHPVPDEAGLDGTRRMLALKEHFQIEARDLVVCLISGGGSALLPSPVPGVNLADKQAVTRLLLACGAPIGEVNIVRKHLSLVKGGGLGRHFAPAQVVSLILSDVIGNRLEVIASSPTYPDSSTFADAVALLRRYELWDRLPVAVADYLSLGERGEVPETPAELPNCRSHIIGDNKLALGAMAAKAGEYGYRPLIVTDSQEGDAGELAEQRTREILAGEYSDYDAVIIGGEATMKLPPEPGKGGRNQHYAAVTLSAMAGYSGEWTAVAAGTDGTDFLPDVAGAIVDRATLDILRNKGVDIADYIRRCDSYHLFSRSGASLLMTGGTGTNVCDVMVYLLK